MGEVHILVGIVVKAGALADTEQRVLWPPAEGFYGEALRELGADLLGGNQPWCQSSEFR